MNDLAQMTFEQKSHEDLYENFSGQLLEEFKQTADTWLRSSRDRFLFETLIMRAGQSK